MIVQAGSDVLVFLPLAVISYHVDISRPVSRPFGSLMSCYQRKTSSIH